MKIRASKKYIEGIDMLAKAAQKVADDAVTLIGKSDPGYVNFVVDVWRAMENYRYILKRADTDDEVILLADGEGNELKTEDEMIAEMKKSAHERKTGGEL